jgi:hypothetical protein
MGRNAKDLVAACEKARTAGKDFPTIWRTILQPDPLVISLPTHDIRKGKPHILISLANGQTLLSTHNGYRRD